MTQNILYGDCLKLMQGMSDDTIDLVYADPPFHSAKNYTGTAGSFSDKWNTQDEYLDFMKVRLAEMHRLLKPTGSLYLHCDPTASHYLKIVLDSIFGEKHFRREIIWSPEAVSGYKTLANNWIRGHDNLFYYTKSDKFTFNKQTQPHKTKYYNRFNKTDEDGRKYFDGRGERRYLDVAIKRGVSVSDVWSDILSFQQTPTSGEKTGYPTQKPEALLERIIKSSSDKNDVVLDPFCGSGTTCKVASDLGRRYMGMDISKKACSVSRKRLRAKSKR